MMITKSHNFQMRQIEFKNDSSVMKRYVMELNDNPILIAAIIAGKVKFGSNASITE